MSIRAKLGIVATIFKRYGLGSLRKETPDGIWGWENRAPKKWRLYSERFTGRSNPEC